MYFLDALKVRYVVALVGAQVREVPDGSRYPRTIGKGRN